jgi:hypothetical protein
MQTGHKLDKQDMVPDAREIMHTWYGTFMGHMGHELDGIEYNGDIGDMRLLQHHWGLNGDIGDISPVDIGHEMDPVLAKRGRERKGLIKGSNGSFKGRQRGTGLNLGVSFFICLGNLWDSSVYKFISSRNEY